MSDVTFHRIQTPLSDSDIATLRAGDSVKLSGTLIGMRDAAHRRVVKTHRAGGVLPVDFNNETIYYTGPAPAKAGWAAGPAGPTTSSRMDPYAPVLMELGVKAMIGKGKRDAEVRDAIIKHRSVYFHAVGGAAALIASQITRVETIAYEDLGAEAIFRIHIEGMSLVVAMDSQGNDIYEIGKHRYRTLQDD